jgi:hypothetical protein
VDRIEIMPLVMAAPISGYGRLAAQGLSDRRIARRLGRAGRGRASSRSLRAFATDTRPPLPTRPTPHERDGRQDTGSGARPHPQAAFSFAWAW